MSQTKRTPRTAEASHIIGGTISKLIVFAVFVVLAIILISRTELPSSDETAGHMNEVLAETFPAAPSGQRQYNAPPPMQIDPAKTYVATIVTPRGNIQVRLLPDIAPQTVNNFVFLAREGFYNGVTWHRVIEGFMAQAGDPTGTGMGGPGYTIPAEFTSKIRFDRPGLLAMARSSDPDSGGSQFFITTGPARWLDNQYTIFGEVIEGQEIVDGIPPRDPETAVEPGERILMISISEE